VVGRPDPHSGEVPVAFVTLAAGTAAAPHDLAVWAADRVPERAAAPKHVEIVDEVRDALWQYAWTWKLTVDKGDTDEH
jgi:acyl-coenzyme A synthetase/AMP-(fatty) acid ligase